VENSRSGRKRKRTSVSESSKSSPIAAQAWTRQPPKPPRQKKKKLIAGRELRDRGARKGYAEPSSSDEDFEDQESDEDAVEEEEVEEVEDNDEFEVEEAVDGDVVRVEKPPMSRRITLKIKSGLWQQMSQEAEPQGSNGTKDHGDDEGLDAVADDEPDTDLQAEVQDLQEDAQIVMVVDDDDDEGPRRPTRRVTRQSLESNKKETESTHPSHGRKGVARQSRSNANGDKATSPQEGRRSSMRSRLRKQMHRSSREDKKKKRHVSESEFEDEGADDPADDDLSIASDGNGIVDDDSEEGYSSAPRRHSRKPPPPRAKSRRSRNVSNADSGEDGDLIEELRDIGAELPPRQRQLRPTERMNYFIPPPPDKDDVFLTGPSTSKKRTGTGRGFGGFGGFGGDFSNMGLGDRFRGINGLGTAGGADDSSDSVVVDQVMANI
jgi:hypothetical protein